MNLMAFAHFMTRRSMAISSRLGYKKLFKWALVDAHRFNKQGTLESRIAEIKATEKRIENEKSVVRAIVKSAIEQGYTVSLSDGQEWTVKRSTSLTEVMQAIMTTESDSLRFRNDAQEVVGGVFLVYGNSASEVMADWSDNEITKAIVAKAVAKQDSLAEQGL